MTKIVIEGEKQIPVFMLDSDTLANTEGLKSFVNQYKLEKNQVAFLCDVSPRTVEGWFQGRPMDEAKIHRLYHYQQAVISNRQRERMIFKRGEK